MRRRDFVKLAGTTAMSWPIAARAQLNSSRPITMIVPFPPGGLLQASAAAETLLVAHVVTAIGERSAIVRPARRRPPGPRGASQA